MAGSITGVSSATAQGLSGQTDATDFNQILQALQQQELALQQAGSTAIGALGQAAGGKG